MAEKLRSEYNAALLTTDDAPRDKIASTGGANNRYYQTSSSYVSSSSNTGSTGATITNPNCNICAVLPSFTGKTQEELDIIAKNMTNQIISDMESGKLARSQINEPNWFENRVAQTLEELNKQKQSSSSSSSAVVYHQPIYNFNNAAAGGMHQQSQQQSLFNQGGHYQGQTQSQHSLYYAPTTSTNQRSRYFNTQSSVAQYPPNPNLYQTTNVENRQRTSDERSQSSVYHQPRPVVVGSESIRKENNCSSTATSQHTVAAPLIPVVQQSEYTYSEDIDEGQQHTEDFGQQQIDFGQTQLDIDRHEYDYTRNVINPTTPASRQYETSYFTQQHNTIETEERVPPLPRQPTPTPPSIRSQTINRTRIETTHDRNYVPIVVIPSQQTVVSASSVNVTEHEHHHRPPPPVYRPILRPSTTNTYHRQEETIENDRIQNRPVQPSYNNVQTYDHRRSEEKTVNNVNIQTPAPTVVSSSSKHSIYGYLDESSEYILPNYRPRVVIDKNSEFHALDQRREPVQQPQQVSKIVHTREISVG